MGLTNEANDSKFLIEAAISAKTSDLMTSKDVIIARMEAIGEEEVRRQLASSKIPDEYIAMTQLWLGEKEAERKSVAAAATRAAERQAEQASTQTVLSSAALLISIIALLVAMLKP